MYTTYKDIYNKISKRVRVEASGRKKTKSIPYSLYFNIVTKFFDILVRDLVIRKQRIFLPLNLGFLFIEKKEHTRAFHIRKDNAESKLKGEPIRYKVPILDNYYYKISWAKKGSALRKCKLYPAKKVRELIKETYNAN